MSVGFVSYCVYVMFVNIVSKTYCVYELSMPKKLYKTVLLAQSLNEMILCFGSNFSLDPDCMNYMITVDTAYNALFSM